ncbi:Methyltransferase domain-containing protein [Asanoa hainanensis]|uniref:Methyltransferase domain-containing protein n=1 Tax=Asanoa hainanensis TaxID=560556 RepID=A0A239NTN7_9ACTN|nr:class I SAM-dependent methyltransferase [Asanoa hainanensis]SNT58100.1 Methyltransferase domain-containing protein [Asanoa hainanensis]
MDAQGWDNRYAETDLVWSASPNRFVADELTGLAPGTAVDLAAGEGRNALWLASLGWRVTAVDFSAVALDKGRQLADARGLSVSWVHADLTDYVPPVVDLVLIAYLQVPPALFEPVLRRAAAAVAPGGTFLAVGHDATNLTSGTGGPQDPARLWTPAGVVASLGDLVVRRADSVRRPVDGARDAIDTLVRAERAR